MRVCILKDRPTRPSGSFERSWSLDEALRRARGVGADVFRHGSGYRLEFDDENECEDFADRLVRGGFRVSEYE